MTTAIFMAAGASSRFGGRIKALAKVGLRGETLIELSMMQARLAGVTRFVIVVNERTRSEVESRIGPSFMHAPVVYAMHKDPPWRKKPIGTAGALYSARDFVGPERFILCSSDDLMGKSTWKKLVNELERGPCIPGYRLENVVPREGKVNRAIMRETRRDIQSIEEHFGIKRSDIPERYSGKEPSAMLIYGFHPDFWNHLQEFMKRFISKRPAFEEALIQVPVNSYLETNRGKIRLIYTTDTPLFLTFPEDEGKIKDALKVDSAHI